MKLRKVLWPVVLLCGTLVACEEKPQAEGDTAATAKPAKALTRKRTPVPSLRTCPRAPCLLRPRRRPPHPRRARLVRRWSTHSKLRMMQNSPL